MKKRGFILLASVCCLIAISATTFAASSPTKVVIAYSSLNERGLGALLVARDQGMFRKNDLDAHPIFVRSGAVALSALSSGDAQFYFGSANGSVLGAMAGGLDAVFVGGFGNNIKPTSFVGGLANKRNAPFVGWPGIQSPADLKNKNIGIQSVGGGVWMITLLALD